MENKDQIIVCKDCQREFVFTEGEQEFYAQKQFSAPLRCKECRQAKKQNNRSNRQERE